MAARWQSILLTPNVLGKDGVSALSREIARAVPGPAVIVSLHDKSVPHERSPVELDIRGARGSRGTFFFDALQAARQANPGVTIVCSHLHLAPIARLVSLIAGHGARPVTVLCGIEAWVPLRPLERWALAASDLVAISRHTVERFKAANPAFSGVDVRVCHPGVPAVSAAAPRFGEPSIALIVARMSSAERYKGHDTLLDVWPHVLARHPDAVLAVAGDGDDRERLELKARELGVHGSVTFAGRVGDSALAGLYARCRFFVMPSRDEGFGLVFLEAMRAAKPCIGGAGAASEIIEHERTGILVEPGNPTQLLAAVLRLYEESDTCKRFGDAGRARFLGEFTDRKFQLRFARTIGVDATSHDLPPFAASA